jgi:hypothetical protein
MALPWRNADPGAGEIMGPDTENGLESAYSSPIRSTVLSERET